MFSILLSLVEVEVVILHLLTTVVEVALEDY